MKKAKLIYNPYSGERVILSDLDKVVSTHQNKGYQVVPFRIDKDLPLSEAFNDDMDQYSHIIVAGGDGTVDSVVNEMKSRDIDIPIGILPVGTANDFAKFLGIPHTVEEACIQILDTEPKNVDLGMINEKYFINVASTGLFTDVSQKTDVNLKNTIGKLAYYIKGIEQLPSFRKLKVNITSEEFSYDDTMYLMLVFNGQTAGNFKVATKADLNDGLLDVIVFKAIPIVEFLPLFIKMLRGEHLDDQRVVYFKTNNLHIECQEDIVTDIDGEKGPDFPLDIKCIKSGLRVVGIK